MKISLLLICAALVAGTPVIGAYTDRYEPVAETLPEEEVEETPLTAHVETNEDSLYRVIVVDEDGNPIPEVAVQFCSDTACMLGETDETGTAVFEEEKGHYTVHILEAPEEYIVEEEVFTLEEFCDLTVFLSSLEK